MRYIVIKRNFLENIMDVELKEPTENGFFYEGINLLVKKN